MTAKEKLKMDFPNISESRFEDIHKLCCPDDYNYLDRPAMCHLNCKPITPYSEQFCVDCWNRTIPETNKEPIRMSREEVTELYSIVEKALETKKEEKETVMTGVKETQCTSCIHREVCKLKNAFLEACDGVANFKYTHQEDDSIVRLADVHFIYPVELKCKYYQNLINVRNGAFDVTNLCGTSSSTAGDPNVTMSYANVRG